MPAPFLVNANMLECCLVDNHHTNIDARVEDTTSLVMFITCEFTKFAQSQATVTTIG